MTDFVPPTSKTADPNEYQWATYVRGRHPQFKIHRTISHAKAAISNKFWGERAKCEMVIYHKEDDQWVVHLQLTKGDTTEKVPWLLDPETEEQKQQKYLQQDWRIIISRLAEVFASAPAHKREALGKALGKFQDEVDPVIKS